MKAEDKWVLKSLSSLPFLSSNYVTFTLLKIPSATSHVQNILILKYEEIQYIFYILNVLFISTWSNNHSSL